MPPSEVVIDLTVYVLGTFLGTRIHQETTISTTEKTKSE